MNARKMLIGLAVLSLGVSQASADLVGLWRFDAQADPQPDSSEFKNDAAVIEASWVDDPDRGGVMLFEGEGDNVPVQWLEVEDSDSLSIEETGLTIVAWANFFQFDSWNSIVAKTGANSTNKPSPYDVYTLNGGDGRVQLYVGSGDGAITPFAADLAPEAETWTHIAITLDEDGEVIHYLDGEENGVGFIDREASLLIDEDQNLFIGSRLDGTTNMHGLLDDVAIFNHALTEAEVAKVMAGDFSAYLGGGGDAGDFNADGVLDAIDIDALSAAVRDGLTDGKFDVSGDGSVDSLDRDEWVNGLKNTYFGDANLDGEFNSGDLVSVFQGGKFETGEPANWSLGDWDGDGVFGSGDFVKAFQGGGFEQGPRGAVAAVPEPSTLVLIVCGMLPLFGRLRRR